MCCLAGGGERTFEEDVACVFGRLDSEEVPAEVAYSTVGGGGLTVFLCLIPPAANSCYALLLDKLSAKQPIVFSKS